MSMKIKWIGLIGLFALLMMCGMLSAKKVIAAQTVSGSNQLRSAIENKTKDVSVKLTDSISLEPNNNNYTIDITSDVTIDLNGNKLSLGKDYFDKEFSMFHVKTKGKLHITNSKYKTQIASLTGGAGDSLSNGIKSSLIVNSGSVELEHIVVKNLWNKCGPDNCSDQTNTVLCVMEQGNLTMHDCIVKNVKARFGYLIVTNPSVVDYKKTNHISLNLENVTIGTKDNPVYGGVLTGENNTTILNNVSVLYAKPSAYVVNNPSKEESSKSNTGGMKIKSGASVTMKGQCLFANVDSYNNAGTIRIVESTKNQKALMRVEKDATLTIRDCCAHAGYLSGRGGAIIIKGQSLDGGSLVNNGKIVLDKNHADGAGGGIIMESDSTIKNNGELVMTGNTANASGGAMCIEKGANFENAGILTISQNKAGASSAGSAMDIDGVWKAIKNSTTEVSAPQAGREQICIGGELYVSNDVKNFRVSDEHHSMSCIRVTKSGYAQIKKGTIMGGTNGIIDKGNLILEDVSITGCTQYGIHQYGTCTVGKSFYTQQPIFLEKKVYLCVDGNMNRTFEEGKKYSSAMVLKTAEDDRALGRKMLEIIAGNATTTQAQIARMAEQGMTNLACGSNRFLRAGRGTDQNGAVNMAVLSTNYKITYKGENGVPATYYATNVPKDSNDGWWHENYKCEFTTPLLHTKDGKKALYEFIGWSLNKAAVAKSDTPGVYQTSQTIKMTGDVTWYGIWKQMPAIEYQGNYKAPLDGMKIATIKRAHLLDEPTDDKKYRFRENVGEDGTAPWFEQAFLSGDDKYKYSFVGWSLDKRATYKNIGISKDGAVYLPAQEISIKELENSAMNLSAVKSVQGRDHIILQAIYDAYPRFLACEDVTILDTQIEDLTQKQILHKVIVEDEEDGILKNGAQVIIKDFDVIKEEMKLFESTGAISACIVATDGYGNETTKEINIWVLQADGQDKTDYYTRYINEDAYERDYKEGGLLEDSIWYTDENYVQTIQQAFSNLKNNTPKEQWIFSEEQIKKVQQWVQHYGIAGLKEASGEKKLEELFAECKNG
ncbi:hypothetical protein [Eubacterium oxidoreducens]|uniref:Uncharacterized protein n=1 Tax=Eubacterium oxidoreducens TaxID=1732 RepID=A0A1G6BD13_EUBOX|nr:hypothetical protein [Eubacterium oxidoreducens]SDB18484.1 hypothetical protein SAMN02910417_01388 [Eubacterium oxidoreducens]